MKSSPTWANSPAPSGKWARTSSRPCAPAIRATKSSRPLPDYWVTSDHKRQPGGGAIVTPGGEAQERHIIIDGPLVPRAVEPVDHRFPGRLSAEGLRFEISQKLVIGTPPPLRIHQLVKPVGEEIKFGGGGEIDGDFRRFNFRKNAQDGTAGRGLAQCDRVRPAVPQQSRRMPRVGVGEGARRPGADPVPDGNR